MKFRTKQLKCIVHFVEELNMLYQKLKEQDVPVDVLDVYY